VLEGAEQGLVGSEDFRAVLVHQTLIRLAKTDWGSQRDHSSLNLLDVTSSGVFRHVICCIAWDQEFRFVSSNHQSFLLCRLTKSIVCLKNAPRFPYEVNIVNDAFDHYSGGLRLDASQNGLEHRRETCTGQSVSLGGAGVHRDAVAILRVQTNFPTQDKASNPGEGGQWTGVDRLHDS